MRDRLLDIFVPGGDDSEHGIDSWDDPELDAIAQGAEEGFRRIDREIREEALRKQRGTQR